MAKCDICAKGIHFGNAVLYMLPYMLPSAAKTIISNQE